MKQDDKIFMSGGVAKKTFISQAQAADVQTLLWVQGLCRSMTGEGSSTPILIIDDGTGIMPCQVSESTVRKPDEESVIGVGSYVQVVGELKAANVGSTKELICHKIFALQDPNMESLWMTEVSLLQK